MSAMQRRKGANGERELAGILSETLGIDVRRKLGQARDGGDDMEVPRAGGGAFLIESKRRGQIAAAQFLVQAELAAERRNAMLVGSRRFVPVVAMREDGGEWIAMMRLSDFLPLLGNEVAR